MRSRGAAEHGQQRSSWASGGGRHPDHHRSHLPSGLLKEGGYRRGAQRLTPDDGMLPHSPPCSTSAPCNPCGRGSAFSPIWSSAGAAVPKPPEGRARAAGGMTGVRARASLRRTRAHAASGELSGGRLPPPGTAVGPRAGVAMRRSASTRACARCSFLSFTPVAHLCLPRALYSRVSPGRSPAHVPALSGACARGSDHGPCAGPMPRPRV